MELYAPKAIKKGARPEVTESKNWSTTVQGGEATKPEGQLEAVQVELKIAIEMLRGLLPPME